MLKVLLVIVVVTVVLYMFLRLVERIGSGKANPSRGTTRTVAPDDDVDFLRDIDFERRRGRAKDKRDQTDQNEETPEA